MVTDKTPEEPGFCLTMLPCRDHFVPDFHCLCLSWTAVLGTFQAGVSLLFLLGRRLVVLPNLGGAGDRNILADYAHVNEAVDFRQIIRRPERTRF